MSEELSKEEKLRAYRRNWYLKNKERTREARLEATRKWREANPSKYQKSYEEQNDKQREKRREYAQRGDVKERRRKLQQERRSANPELYVKSSKESHFKKKYGLTLAERDAIFTRQGDACAACGETDIEKAGRWVVDHCHEHQVVRGILCYRCNVALGLIKDNPATLRALADYLER